MIGRQTKLTPQVRAAICQRIAAGNHKNVAAVSCGVDPATFYEWIARGEGRDPDRAQTPLYADFAEAVKKAEADAEVRNVALIEQAAGKEWTAAAWWLERKFPERWAKKQEAPAIYQDNRSITVLAEMNDDQLRQALAAAIPAQD